MDVMKPYEPASSYPPQGINEREDSILFLILFFVFLGALYIRFNNNTYAMLIINTLQAVIPIMLYLSNKRSFSHLGFQRMRLLKQIIHGILSSVVIFTLVMIISMALGAAIQLRHLPFKTIIINFFYSMFLIGFGEEVFWRGFLIDQLERRCRSTILSLLLSSVLFGLIHLVAHGSISQTVFSAVFGLVLACLYKKMKNFSILALTLTHGLYNFFYGFILLTFR